MSTTDIGNQEITFAYKEYAKGSEFNKQLRNIIRPGIYNGGWLSKASSTSILVSAFSAWFNVDSDKACNITTSSGIIHTVSEATPVLYMKYTWADSVTNFIDFGFKSTSAAAIENEIIFGKTNFTSGVVDGTFDYSNRTLGLIDSSGNIYISNKLKFDSVDNCSIYKGTSGTIYTPNYIKAQAFLVDITNITTISGSLYSNNIYHTNYSSGRCTVTLPLTSNFGDTISIRDVGNYGWKINQNQNQNIQLPNGRYTVSGVIGEIHSRAGGAIVDLECIVPNLTWKIVKLQDEWVMKGYCMGGLVSSPISSIEDFHLILETSTLLSQTLSVAKSSGMGASSNLKGYCIGGNTGSGPTNVIEAMIFASEIRGSVTGTLAVAKFSGASVQTHLKGYGMGGNDGGAGPYINTINDFTFLSETATTISATLDAIRSGISGIYTTLKGYGMGGAIVGGAGFTNVISNLNFITETSDEISATLVQARHSGPGVSGSRKGYVMGGQVLTGSGNTIEGFTFTSEINALITAILSDQRHNGVTGVVGQRKGYCMGGYWSSPVNYIEDLNFTTETSDLISATLDVARYRGVCIQGYIG